MSELALGGREPRRQRPPGRPVADARRRAIGAGEHVADVVYAEEDEGRLTEEIADLFYHLLVLMLECDIGLEQLTQELVRRRVVR